MLRPDRGNWSPEFPTLTVFLAVHRIRKAKPVNPSEKNRLILLSSNQNLTISANRNRFSYAPLQ
jgi:hypothetical protein